MPNLISETEIESIITNFDAKITEYEIIDIEKYQGWSSKHLYLLVTPEEDFVLKAKSTEQILGYDNEVTVSNALLDVGILTRRPILTKDGKLFSEQYGYFWCLMTYIPGASSHVNEYSEGTVKSLAEHINQYVLASNSNDRLKNLNLKQTIKKSELEILDEFFKQGNYLESIGILKITEIKDIHLCLKEGNKRFENSLKTKSIIHNDVNSRNILMDHKSKDVIALIDWDHVRYGNPLKDLSDAISIFYDTLPLDKASKYKKFFYSSFTSPWFKEIDKEAVEYHLVLYYTIAKWQAILFYLGLLRKYDNKYGERDRFIYEMKQIYTKWFNAITSVSA
jgi:thiamine kinase-like enzyme